MDRILISPNGNTGVYSLSNTGSKLWQTVFVKDGSLNSSPAIGTFGRTYAGSNDSKVYALSNAGAVLWIFPTTNANIRSTGALFADRLYIGDDGGTLYCIGE